MAIDFDELYARIGRMIEGTTEGVARLAEREFVGEARGGRVRAVVTGGKTLVSIDFAPWATREIDNITLGEAVVAAVNDAEDQADDQRAAMLREHLPPGFDPDALLRDPASLVPRIRNPFGEAGRR